MRVVPILFCSLITVALTAAQNKPSYVPNKLAEAALNKVHLIRPGMTLAQAWRAVGLEGRQLVMGRGSGPTTRFSMNFELTPKHRIGLEIDSTKKPARVVKATAVWLQRGR